MGSNVKAENEVSNSNNVEKKPRELKDLDAEILLKIFKYLLVSDLVNIVEYDVDLKTTALSAFKEKLAADAIIITNQFNPHNETSSPSAQLLNHFGNEITKLVVHYEEEYREISKVINDAIVLQCYKTLEEIEFHGAGRFTMFGISKQFENVHTVSFRHGELCEIISQFGKWFPKAHTLKLYRQGYGEYCNGLNMEMNPYLKHLVIGKLNNYDNSNGFLKKIIELSPALETLRLEIGGIEIRIDDTLINANMPNIESLHLKLLSGTHIFNPNKEELHFEKLKCLTMEYPYSVLEQFPIRTDNLQILKLNATEGVGRDCVEFFNNNRNLEFVEIVAPYTTDSNDVISSLSKLPNLKEVQFPFPCFYDKVPQLDQMQVILMECKHLYKLNVTAKNIDRKYIPGVESSMKSFAATVDQQWKNCVTKEVIPYYNGFRINYRLSLEKKQSDRTSRMEQRMKRKATTPIDSKNACKRLKSINNVLELDDLNDDCLIAIFRYLSIDDLVHIVQYNNQFISAALMVFKQKYSNDQIKISVEYNLMTKEPLWCIELLKYFGSEIRKLSVKYYKEDSLEIDDSIDNAIIEYCCKSLVEIQFINSKTTTMNGINRPFENVRTVAFVGGSGSEKVYDLGKYFPKANTLKLEDMDEAKELRKIHIRTAPALEHLEVRLHTHCDSTYNHISGKMIESNPQLKSFYHQYVLDHSYEYDYDEAVLDLYQTLVHLPMPNLESLSLILPNEKRLSESDYYSYGDFPNDNMNKDGKYHFEALRHLHIEFKRSGVLKNLPISTSNLESLVLVGVKNIKGNDCVRFLRDNQNVKSIKIVGRMVNDITLNIHNFCELFAALPHLNELEFSYENYYRFLHDLFPLDVLLVRCISLRLLVINCRDQNDYQEIENLFNNSDAAIKTTWNLSTDENHVNRKCLTFKRLTS